MNKKIVLGLAATGTALAMLPLFAAFEAHVVNVTARIENALAVPIKYLEYGTVFPQEYLVKDVDVSLSQSFQDEGRVDDVEYFIRQKPKCAITWNNGQNYDNTVGSDGTHIYTRTGHVVPNLTTPDPNDYTIECGNAPRNLDTTKGEVWGVLPSLCEYLSKNENTEDENGANEEDLDQSVPAFHVPFTVDANGVHWLEAEGYLSKQDEDTRDNWAIDLAVPCFGGYCAQDWADFVHKYNIGADPDDFDQDIANEHKVFGCDLWIEVSDVSESNSPA